MDNESNEQTPQLSAEAAALAEKGRSGASAPQSDPLNPPSAAPADADKGSEGDPPQRPDNVPEKFWDAENGRVNQDALLASYLELEKTRNQPKDDDEKSDPKSSPKITPDPDDGDDDDPAGDDPGSEDGDQPSFTPEAVTTAVAQAREAYAASGELSDDVRKSLLAVGFTDMDIDMHLAGVKAAEQALLATATATAGGEDKFNAATQWAAKNWSPKQIENFNNSVGDPELVRSAVAGLMADFAQNVGEDESKPLDAAASAESSGNVYRDKDEFLKDLSAATASGDQVARRAAVQKLERSKKAGTIKNVTPRSQPFSL